ncbi:hypothetical protein JCM16358_02730 [Halanaerocella petrolearia]
MLYLLQNGSLLLKNRLHTPKIDVMKKLFDKSRTKETCGSGLGLAIAKWIVDNHAGKIKAKSKVNQGTKIIVILPAC